MNNTQKIKEKAKSAFANEEYHLAFKTLWEAGVSQFVAYAERETDDKKHVNWFTHSGSANVFWTEFIFEENHFNAIFESETADTVLFNYFSQYSHRVAELEERLAKEFPLLFVKGVRLNEAFLKPDRIESLISAPLGGDWDVHQKVWERIFKHEQANWNEIQDHLAGISTYSISEILSQCIIWLECERFSALGKENLHHLGSVYSFFMELVMTEYPDKSEGISNLEDSFDNLLIDSFEKQNVIEAGPVSKLLSSIDRWIAFRDGVISHYSYDLNVEPLLEKGTIFFKSTPEAHYRWLWDGERYQANYLRYYEIAVGYIKASEQRGEIVFPGKTERDVNWNRKMEATRGATLMFLEDMGNSFFIIGNTAVESERLLTPLLVYSFNRMIRYEVPFRKYSKKLHSWHESFGKVKWESIKKDVLVEPFFLMTEEGYKELNQDGLSGLPEDCTNEIAQLFSFQPNGEMEFNRFKLNYDVVLKPFSRIGDFLFCPMMFFANNEWFYSFGQVALTHRKTDRRETELMEKSFAEAFMQKGWTVKLLGDEESKKLEGDVDIFVEDDDTLLFIQLKRAYFRLSLKDAYTESIKSDAKAAAQLNDAENYLEQPNEIYEIKHKPVKWIVSTSFENVSQKIKGCTKVNYFEVLDALQNLQTSKLSDFIDFIEADKYLAQLMASGEEEALFKPLAMFEARHYVVDFFSEDASHLEHNSLFNRAMDMNRKGRKDKALLLFQDYIALCPNDGSAHAAIANILADMRLFEKAFAEFEKALELLPNDPYISRNYFLALLEARKYHEGLSLALALYEKFPLYGDLWIVIKNWIAQCVEKGFLGASHMAEILERWDNLNRVTTATKYF